MSREVMKMALDALSTVLNGDFADYMDEFEFEMCRESMTALRAELAKRQPAPVVWMQSNHLDKFEQHACGADSMLARCSHRQLQPDYVPLYRKEDI